MTTATGPKEADHLEKQREAAQELGEAREAMDKAEAALDRALYHGKGVEKAEAALEEAQARVARMQRRLRFSLGKQKEARLEDGRARMASHAEECKELGEKALEARAALVEAAAGVQDAFRIWKGAQEALQMAEQKARRLAKDTGATPPQKVAGVVPDGPELDSILHETIRGVQMGRDLRATFTIT